MLALFFSGADFTGEQQVALSFGVGNFRCQDIQDQINTDMPDTFSLAELEQEDQKVCTPSNYRIACFFNELIVLQPALEKQDHFNFNNSSYDLWLRLSENIPPPFTG